MNGRHPLAWLALAVVVYLVALAWLPAACHTLIGNNR